MQKLIPGTDRNGQESVAGGQVEKFLPAAFEELRDRMCHWEKKRDQRLKQRSYDKKRIHAQGRLAMGARHEKRRIGVAVFAGMRAPVVDALGDGCRNVDDLGAANRTGGGIAKPSGDERAKGEVFNVVKLHSTIAESCDDFLKFRIRREATKTS